MKVQCESSRLHLIRLCSVLASGSCCELALSKQALSRHHGVAGYLQEFILVLCLQSCAVRCCSCNAFTGYVCYNKKWQA